MSKVSFTQTGQEESPEAKHAARAFPHCSIQLLSAALLGYTWKTPLAQAVQKVPANSPWQVTHLARGNRKASRYCSGAAKDKGCLLQPRGCEKHGAERRLQQSWETNQGSRLCCPATGGLLCSGLIALRPASASCTQRGSSGHAAGDEPHHITCSEPCRSCFPPPRTQPSKRLLHIWWSSEKIWWSSSGRERWWSHISQGCPLEPGLPTSLTSASHLVIFSLLMICTTLGSLSCLIRACILH